MIVFSLAITVVVLGSRAWAEDTELYALNNDRVHSNLNYVPLPSDCSNVWHWDADILDIRAYTCKAFW